METAEAPVEVDVQKPRGGEQSRARYPDAEGFAERAGKRLFYEVYGEGEETVFLLPTWSLVHSRHWKMQIAYFARHFRVLTMDGYQLELGRLAPARAAGAAFIGPLFPYTPSHWSAFKSGPLSRLLLSRAPFRWWGHFDATKWPERYPEFAQWFFERCFSEPHSTKGIEDGVGWALDTDSRRLPPRSPTASTPTARPCASWRRECPAPSSWSRATATGSRLPATGASWPASAAASWRSSAAPATSPTPASRFRSTWRCAISPRTASAARARRATRPSTAPTAAPAPSSSPRRSASATPSATSRSPAARRIAELL